MSNRRRDRKKTKKDPVVVKWDYTNGIEKSRWIPADMAKHLAEMSPAAQRMYLARADRFSRRAEDRLSPSRMSELISIFDSATRKDFLVEHTVAHLYGRIAKTYVAKIKVEMDALNSGEMDYETDLLKLKEVMSRYNLACEGDTIVLEPMTYANYREKALAMLAKYVDETAFQEDDRYTECNDMFWRNLSAWALADLEMGLLSEGVMELSTAEYDRRYDDVLKRLYTDNKTREFVLDVYCMALSHALLSDDLLDFQSLACLARLLRGEDPNYGTKPH